MKVPKMPSPSVFSSWAQEGKSIIYKLTCLCIAIFEKHISA